MDLLQITAMDATFALKDVIYIVTGVGAAVGFYWKMIVHDKEMDTKIKQMKKDVEKNESIMFKKFTGIHARMDKNEEKSKTELDAINTEINEVKIGISTINGKLDILINK
jgi:preprotein translocase subunit YajC